MVFVIGFALGGFFTHYWTSSPMQAKVKTPTKKIKYWVAPMDANYRRDKPGKSPMGMDLVPVYANEGDNDELGIRISPTVVNNLGIKTAVAKKTYLSRAINTVGLVQANEGQIEKIHTYVDGWVRQLQIKSVGDAVKSGQVLFKLYSPTLINAQQEYLLALKSANQPLIKAGEKKLVTLGFSQNQIKQLRQSRHVTKNISIYAPTSGVVSQLGIRDGMYIKPDVNLMVIEDLSSVWVQVAIAEKQVSWVKKNQLAIARFSAYPGKLWQGNVIYVYPALDKQSHTLTVRLQFPNPDLSLKPGMYAKVKILVQADKKNIVVPLDAVIVTSSGDRVIVEYAKGRFKAVPVVIGAQSLGKVEVITGLKAGDKVVVSGQFLLDSESKLDSELSRMTQRSEHTKKSSNTAFEATIIGIDLQNHSLTIAHQSIDELAMPDMVMELPVSKTISLQQYRLKQKIMLKLKQIAPHRFVIIAINPVTKDAP